MNRKVENNVATAVQCSESNVLFGAYEYLTDRFGDPEIYPKIYDR